MRAINRTILSGLIAGSAITLVGASANAALSPSNLVAHQGQVTQKSEWLKKTAATIASPVSAQPNSVQAPVTGVGTGGSMPYPVQAPATGGQTGVGMPYPVPPPAAPDADTGIAAYAAPGANPADITVPSITVPPTHRETLDDCMGYWDTQTHMSKSQWRDACRRTLNGTDMVGVDDLLGPEKTAAAGRKRHHGLRAGYR